MGVMVGLFNCDKRLAVLRKSRGRYSRCVLTCCWEDLCGIIVGCGE